MNLKPIKQAIPSSLKQPLRQVLKSFNLLDSILSRQASADAERLEATLDPWFTTRLMSMYRREPQLGGDGMPHELDSTRISLERGLWLYDFCLEHQPEACVEIGLAYGYSTLFIMAALAKLGSGEHTSIDPFQNVNWKGVGVKHARDASTEFGVPHSFIEELSSHAATDLVRAEKQYDLVFIDGGHRFDDVLVDFYLYAPLCTVGGHLIFDDTDYCSIQSVMAYIRTNRSDFVEVPGVPKRWCAFKRVGEDQRHWLHFRNFPVSRDSNGPT